MVRRISFLLVLACTCHALRAELPPDILELPPFERAVAVIKHFEGWHSARHYPYYPKQNVIQSFIMNLFLTI